jgi:hypothetical protein
MHEISIPPLKVWVKKEFLHNHEFGHGEWEMGLLVSARSISGNAMLFQVLLENGALRDKLPIHSFVWCTKRWEAQCKEQEPPFHYLQLWNCFSANFSAVEIDFLSGLRVDAVLKDKSIASGMYLWSFQWGPDATHGIDLTQAIDPSEHKSGHFLKLDNGMFAIQPNNRLRFYDPAHVTKPFPDRPDYKVNTDKWNCEAHAKWVTEGSNNWAYDLVEIK